MESCGQAGRIHLSEDTAKELVKHGKKDWLTRREDQIEAKGKGKLTTFWLTPAGGTGAGSSTGESDFNDCQNLGETMQALSQIPTVVLGNNRIDHERPESRTWQLKQSRLIDWNTELLLGHLKRVVARRNVLRIESEDPDALDDLARKLPEEAMAFDSVQEIIEMPAHVFDGNCSTCGIDLGADVQSQLRDYVSHIATVYSEENPFHNFVSLLFSSSC